MCRVAKRLIERDGQSFRRHQHHRAEFQACQLAQPAKDAVEPVRFEPRNPLAVEEPAEDVAVLLLLGDEKLQSRQPLRI